MGEGVFGRLRGGGREGERGEGFGNPTILITNKFF